MHNLFSCIIFRETQAMTNQLKSISGTFERGHQGYEAARRASVWNARLPDRFPDIIVQASDVNDVVAAVRQAKARKLKLTVRSGGHSWAANHVRDGGLLLDVSRLDAIQVDKKAMRATVGPGRSGHELAAKLGGIGLFFPSGHCRGVAVGGYLLQGGYGWHSRTLGPACMSVLGIDVVTAEGEILHISETENADLFWAARGAGPGFFAVATRFHVRLYKRPRIIGFATQSFPIDKLEQVFRWAHAIGPSVSPAVELQLILTRHAPGVRGTGIMVFAPVFADSLGEALKALAFLNKSPLNRQTTWRVPFIPSGLSLMYHEIGRHYPDNYRYAVDNMWTHAGIEDLLPSLKRIAETLPPAPSHALWLNWMPPKTRPAMAYSIEDDIYLALYGVWKQAKDDAKIALWPEQRLREMEHLASGCQLADENLGQRPARFVIETNMKKLDQLRALHDPQSRFQPWMGRP